MKNVQKIIKILGGLDRLRQESIQLAVEGFMPLSIEVIGSGPCGGTLISVMHWFEQNGDLMRDPDLEVEIDANSGDWLPVSYRQDSLGILQVAIVAGESGLSIRKPLMDDLLQFMELWDQNLEEQGFVKAAEVLASEKDGSTESGD